ncbi:MAG: M14 metallopeptidase family protein, partial [Bacteroidota bacterium]
MNKRRSSVLYILLLCFCSVSLSQVKSPSEFLGYELGSQFTRHHQVLDYFYYIAEQKSKLVEIKEYGRTYEDRPMILAFISGADNIKKLESIRMDNLKRAGLVDGAPTNPVSIVWLSYNVHGNEAVSTEASLQTLYELVKSEDSELDFLKNTVVVIDPCLNPDGRERYVNFYWENGAFPFNPDPYASEHFERWPGGRPNHYLFDLNRDWAWQSQIESKQRMKVYNEWLPHIHVDFHEQGVNSPYYFAPAAEPFHELITDFQRDFQVEIGKNHAKYFDEKGWLYFTRQVFDLLYPSYGDTYPTFNGSIGMTYEQGGSGRAGLGIIKQEGDTLTLKDRIDHHHTTGFSTIEMASKNVEKILSSFSDFFGDKESLRYKTFILKNDGNEDKMNSLKDWLDAQDIQYNAVESSSGARGVNYAN